MELASLLGLQVFEILATKSMKLWAAEQQLLRKTPKYGLPRAAAPPKHFSLAQVTSFSLPTTVIFMLQANLGWQVEFLGQGH